MNKRIDVTAGINDKVFSILEQGVQQNAVDSILNCIGFFRSVIRKGIQYRSFEVFSEYIIFPSQAYIFYAYRQRKSGEGTTVAGVVISALSLHLKEIIGFVIGIAYDQEKELSGLNELNRYYMRGFREFNHLFYLISRKSDWPLFEKAVRDFVQIRRDDSKGGFARRIQLEALERDNKDGIYDDQIARIKQEDKINGKLWEYKRRTTLVMKYWLYFLYEEKMIKDEHLRSIIAQLEEVYIRPGEDVADLIFFRTNNLSEYMGWEDWDYMDRPTNEAYHPPVASDWITRGYILDRLVTRNTSFFTGYLDKADFEQLRYLNLAITTIKQNLLESFEILQPVMTLSGIEELRDWIEQLQNSIAKAYLPTAIKTALEISQTSLSTTKVKQFTLEVANHWRSELRTRHLFTLFGNITDVTGQDIKLMRVGPYMNLEKGKIAFIDGPHYSEIIGLERIGDEVARMEDNLFFDRVSRSEIAVMEGPQNLMLLNKAIVELRNKGIEPTLIITDNPYWAASNDIRQSELYTSALPDRFINSGLGDSFIGSFAKVPVVNMRAGFLNNKMIVADFAATFNLKVKKDPEWVEQLLSVVVSELSPEQVEKLYSQDPMKWRRTDSGTEMTEEDAKIVVSTSITIDAETIAEVEILDPNSSRIISWSPLQS